MIRHGFIDFALCFITLSGFALVWGLRSKATDSKGIGVRLIQILSIFTIVPVVAILGLEGILSGEGTGTIIGAIVGYALGGIAAPVPSTK